MPSLRNTVLGLAAIPLLSTGAVAKQSLQVVWSSGHFSTISGPSGNEVGHDSGFAITDDKGHNLYSSGFPSDHAPCYNTGNGRTFTMSSSCFKAPRKFKCKADFGGNPKTCEVQDSKSNVLASGKGNVKDKFIGIAISQSGSCGVKFDLEDDEHCDDKATFKVVSG